MKLRKLLTPPSFSKNLPSSDRKTAGRRRGVWPIAARRTFFRPLVGFELLGSRELLSGSSWIIDDGDSGYVESVLTAPLIVDDGDSAYSNSGGNVEQTVDNGGGNYSESPAAERHQSALGGQIDGQSRYSWDNSAVATFSLSGLTDGKNDVFVTTPGHPNGCNRRSGVAV